MASFATIVLSLAVVASAMLPVCSASSSRHLLAGGEKLVQLKGHIPTWATSKSFVGAAPSSDVVHANLHMGYRNPDKVTALADAVSYPTSRSYGRYLTVERFTARFAPTRAHVATVAAWAAAHGLRVAYVPENRKFVALEGTVAGFSAALRMSFGVYNVNGVALRAPRSEPKVPARLAGAHSLAFEGLDQSKFLTGARPSQKKAEPAGHPAVDAEGKLLPSATSGVDGCAWPNATSFPFVYEYGCYYTPEQLRSAYQVPERLTGKGQTVAVVEFYSSPTAQIDLNIFSAIMGLPLTTIQFAYPPLQYNASEAAPRALDQAPPGYDTVWAFDESLALQSVHGMAPNATLVYVGAPDPTSDPNLFAALNYVLVKNLASIVVNSYATAIYTGYSSDDGPIPRVAAQVPIFNDLAKQAAVLGIGLYYPSGDTGQYQYYADYGADFSPSWFAVDPYVTGVGGTTLAIGSQGQYLREYGYSYSICDITDPANLQCYNGSAFPGPPVGSGGGIGYTFATPAYQQLVAGPKRILQAAGFKQGRVVPDVAAVGDPDTGFLFCKSTITSVTPLIYVPAFYTYGGTGLSTAVFAGMVALKQELKNKRLGFANPYFYSITGQFRDILPGPPIQLQNAYANSYYEADVFVATTLKPARGYDNVTGLGTPGPAFWYHNG